jgi:O-antigen ligase
LSGSALVLAVVLGLVLGGIASLGFLRFPLVGLCAVIFTSLFVPFEIGTGTQTGINAATILLSLLVVLGIVRMVLRREPVGFLRSRTFLPLMGLVVVACLAFGAGQLPWFPTSGAPLRSQLGGLAIFVLSAAALLLSAHQLQNLRWLEWLTWFFLAIGGLHIFIYYGVWALFPSLSTLMNAVFTRGVAGSVFWIWLVSLSFSQAAFNPRLGARGRALLWLLLGATAYTRLYLGVEWISGWIPPLAAVVVILLTSGRYLPMVGTLAAGLVTYANASKLAGVVMAGDNPYSLATRLEAWRIMLNIVRVDPLLGVGPANYYWYTSLFPIMGYYVPFNSHNNYIDLLAQTGILGLGCFLWLAWEAGSLASRLRVRLPPGFEQAFVLGCLGALAGSLVAMCLGDWVLPFVYNVGLSGFRSSMIGWLFLGGLVAIEAVLRERDQLSRTESS